MSKEYTPEEMLQRLETHFKTLGYKVERYSKKFLPARVPLHCEKEKDKTDEIIVEITTDRVISKDDFFPSLQIDHVVIPEASPVRFYQYYFPKAKIYYAYPDNVEENTGFDDFKKVCEKRGIGLLKISETGVKELVESCPLFNKICSELIEDKTKPKEIKNVISDLLDSYLHFLVYYPDPVYRRSEIMERGKRIPYKLSDKLIDLKNISYRDELKQFGSEYRQEIEDDYAIAKKHIDNLWKKYLGLSYPNIQIRAENILQRNEKYREHFVHQFQVFLIGAYILDNIYTEVAKNFEEEHGGCKIETVWLAASTFHDFNYGLQNFDIWLMEFFEETLWVKCSQTKENLNLLNLDAAMIREALYDNLTKIINQLNIKWKENQKENLIRFFYEKSVRDRNHGVLSAISLLKLYDKSDKETRKITDQGILQAAIGIVGHDEDVWETLCGCQGYRRSSTKLPEEEKCIDKCGRVPSSIKKGRIINEKISGTNPINIEKYKCESWEKLVMDNRLMEKITFEEYPILFLLIFCDSIQDEGRVGSQQINRSSLKGIDIKKIDGKTNIHINLQSEEQDKKEDELERVAWCLRDDIFRISINEKLIKMNGSGG